MTKVTRKLSTSLSTASRNVPSNFLDGPGYLQVVGIVSFSLYAQCSSILAATARGPLVPRCPVRHLLEIRRRRGWEFDGRICRCTVSLPPAVIQLC